MSKQGGLLRVIFVAVLLIAGNFSYADETFVVTEEVVFVREDPKKVLPHEDGIYSEPFPPHFFYGENITGVVERENPDVVKAKITLYEWEQNKRKEKKITGYIDRKKLWQEPSLMKVPTNLYMTLQDTDVYLIPEETSQIVISLYQGEVVEVVGQVKYGNTSWIKTKFGSTDKGSYYGYSEDKIRESSEPARFGYIKEGDLQPLEAGKVDESKLAISEIPKTMRYSKLTFSDEERERLAARGFYIESVLPAKKVYIDDMVDLYQNVSSAIFITSDLYLHSFHLIFDRMLQDIEEKRLFPEIESLTKKLVEVTKKEIKSNRSNYNKTKRAFLHILNVAGFANFQISSNDKIENALLHNLFFFSVAAKLFDPEFVVPLEVRSDVESIVQRIVIAEGPLPSLKNKIELGEEDFTQYRVRGHYQKKTHKTGMTEEVVTDDLLERYFRGMMWYGRHPFLLSGDIKTISAILITRALETSGEMKRWERINAMLARLIGKTDDWSPEDYSKVIEKVFGTTSPNLEDIATNDKIKDFKEQAVKMLPSQRIVSMQTGGGFTQKERLEMTSGFKFMGQRFTPDAYIFSQLILPSVPRNLPTSLDVMSILGSKAAEDILKEKISAHEWAEDYKSQADKLKKEIVSEIEKKETSYSNWLYTLASLYHATKSKQLFAIQEPWLYKNLNTALGSWTELKHDTILYSEQCYAEHGEGTCFEIPVYEPPYVKGYVEPNPEFFKRLMEMVSIMRLDLQKNRFITDEYNDKLQTFESLVKRACEIAKKEIEGNPITKEDYRWMLSMTRSFDRSLILSRDSYAVVDSETLKMAVIADVATDAVSGQVLEVAVGIPQRITVVVKDSYGGTRITTGYVYSWYEFADTKRWTDEEWKALVYDEDQDKLKKLGTSWYSRFEN
ncbi:MAG: DUF3160 domain-containing protein [Nitrospirota bacterium]